MLPGKRNSHGALFVTTAADAPSDVFLGGVKMTAEGIVHVNANTPQKFDQGKGFMNNGDLCIDVAGSPTAGYMCGLPVTATGALKCQLNQTPTGNDPYVGGIRVGAAGVYIKDIPPTTVGGFSSGFDLGFPGGVLGVFTPLELFAEGEQGCWYDPSDMATMWQDSAGTIPVTAAGQTVGKILDKSGNNNHAYQANAAMRPLLQTDGTYWWLAFDGVDDYLVTASINFTITNKMSLFTGATGESQSTGGVVASCEEIAEVGQFSLEYPEQSYFGASSSIGTGMKGSTATVACRSTNDLAPTLRVIATALNLAGLDQVTSIPVFRQNATDMFREGTLGASSGGGTFVNSELYMGSRKASALVYSGHIYALIVRGAESTQQEIEDTENWVNSKTGAY